jgi:hypothetical protein
MMNLFGATLPLSSDPPLPPLIEEACREIGLRSIHSGTNARAAARQIMRCYRRVEGEYPDGLFWQRRIAARLHWLASGPIPDIAETTEAILWLMEMYGGRRAVLDWIASAPVDEEDSNGDHRR